MSTFHIVRDPNRPLQIDRAAYANIMRLLRQADVELDDLEPEDGDLYTLARAQNAIRKAIVALQQEAEAGNE